MSGTATLNVEGGSSEDQEIPPNAQHIPYKVQTNGLIDFSEVAGDPRE